MRASVDRIIIRFAFVEGCKSVFGIFSWDKAREPSRGALFVLRTPLSRARLASNTNALDLRRMRSPLPVIDDVLQRTPQCLVDLRRYRNVLAQPVRIRSDYFVVQALHLFHETRLMKLAGGSNHAQRLRHLQRRDQNIALTDAHVRDIASLNGAFVNPCHVFVRGNVTLTLGIDGNSGPFSETKTMSVFDDWIGSNLQSDLIEPSVAGLG